MVDRESICSCRQCACTHPGSQPCLHAGDLRLAIPVFNCERKDRCIVETRRLYPSPHILYMSEPHTHSITVSEPAVVTQV